MVWSLETLSQVLSSFFNHKFIYRTCLHGWIIQAAMTMDYMRDSIAYLVHVVGSSAGFKSQLHTWVWIYLSICKILSWDPSCLNFIFLIIIYLTVSGHSCGMWIFSWVMWNLSLWCMDFLVVGHRLWRVQPQ